MLRREVRSTKRCLQHLHVIHFRRIKVQKFKTFSKFNNLSEKKKNHKGLWWNKLDKEAKDIERLFNFKRFLAKDTLAQKSNLDHFLITRTFQSVNLV